MALSMTMRLKAGPCAARPVRPTLTHAVRGVPASFNRKPLFVVRASEEKSSEPDQDKWEKKGSQASEATEGDVKTAQQKGQGIQKKVDNAMEEAGALYKEDQRTQPEKAQAAMDAAVGVSTKESVKARD